MADLVSSLDAGPRCGISRSWVFGRGCVGQLEGEPTCDKAEGGGCAHGQQPCPCLSLHPPNSPVSGYVGGIDVTRLGLCWDTHGRRRAWFSVLRINPSPAQPSLPASSATTSMSQGPHSKLLSITAVSLFKNVHPLGTPVILSFSPDLARLC